MSGYDIPLFTGGQKKLIFDAPKKTP